MIPDAEPENHYAQSDQHRLRLVSCEQCEAKARAMQAMGIDIENLEAQNKANLRLLGRARSELAQERREGPHHAEAQALYEFWREKCRPGARAFGDDRQKAVLGRLNQKEKVKGQKRKQNVYDARFIAEAIKGASLNPNYDKHGRPWNDLELICRDSSHLEAFHDLYKAWKWPEASHSERHELYAAWVEEGRP